MEIVTGILMPLLSAAFGGIVGAYVGYRGALRAQAVEDKMRNRMAGRAVLAEMLVNVERARSAESTRVLHQFLDSTWRGQLPLVAQLLRWPDLKKLIDVYDAADRAFDNAKDGIQKLDERHRFLSQSAPVMGQELERDRQFSRIEQERRKIDA
jgi:hypothetical protein